MTFAELLNTTVDFMYGKILMFLLIGTGIYMTISMKFAQIRYFAHTFSVLRSGLAHVEGGISSFQAFATSLAARIGTGNITGVAVAISMGGPGAIFWMWVVCIVGMATSIVENSLGQLYKIQSDDGAFRGGPAYYMERGLGHRWMGVLFSICLIASFGLAFNAVQANSMTLAIKGSLGLTDGPSSIWVSITCAAVITMLSGVVIFGGVHRIARFAEIVVPFMALAYIAVAIIVIACNITAFPRVLMLIFENAFGLGPAVSGVVGYGMREAMTNGIRRGLFSNEAGLGSSPNAAATADVSHPVTQGFMQMFGVFTDTILVCSATAFIILASDELSRGYTGPTLTQAALATTLGTWAIHFITVAIQFFAFTTIIANYYYSETSLRFVNNNRGLLLPYRILVLAVILMGSFIDIPIIWSIADFSMGFMALLNLVAILILSPLAFRLFQDYIAQMREGRQPVFKKQNFSYIKGISKGVWE